MFIDKSVAFSLTLFLVCLIGARAKSVCQTEIPELAESCPKNQPGKPILFPDPEMCGSFWECYNGCATQMFCHGSLLFNPANGWCGLPQYVDCGSRFCGEDGTCIHNVEPEEDSEAPICDNGDGYFPDENNCARFLICQGDTPTLKQCPVGPDGQLWLYKAENQWCDYPENVKCGNRAICDVKGENCEVGPVEPPSVCDDYVCDGKSGLILFETCSQCACQCAGVPEGLLSVGETCCPGSLVWDVTLGVCNYPSSVDTCK